MRLLLLALLLALLAAAPSSAVLTNKFCASLRNVTLPGDPFLDAQMALSSLCLDFVDSDSFNIELEGFVHYKGVTYAALPATCNGTYAWADPQYITFAYDLSYSFCAQSGASVFGFCNWGCIAFAGTYIPMFQSNLTAPTQLTITPLPPSQSTIYNWGGLPANMPLTCNTTDCGSALGLVPAFAEGGNVTYTVCRLLRCEEASTDILFCVERHCQ